MRILLTQNLKLPGMSEEIQGPLPADKNFNSLADLVNNAIPIVMGIAGVLLLAYLIWGGFDFLTSMGDPKKAEAGKTKITRAIIGFFIIFASYWIVQLIAFALGLQNNATVSF